MADEDLHADGPLDRLPSPRKRHGGLIVTVAILVIFGVVIWYVYQRVTQTSEAMAPPLIKAEQGPVKVPPDSPGGMQVPNQDKSIYDRIGNGSDKGASTEKLLPPPETPKPEAPAPAKPADARAVAVAPLAPPGDTAKGATAALAVPSGTPPAPAPSALDKPPASPGANAPSVPSSALPPSPSPAAKTAAAAPPAAKVAAPAATKTAAPAPTKPAATGSARIQLGAFKQVSDAEQTWQKLSKKFPDLLGGLSLTIVRVDLGEKGIYQRLQAGPLADHAAAVAMCEQLKARKQDCILAPH